MKARPTLPVDRAPRPSRGLEMRVFRRERVGHVWRVAPAYHTLEVYRMEGDRYVLVDTWEGDARVRAEPFEAVELPLAALWAGAST